MTISPTAISVPVGLASALAIPSRQAYICVFGVLSHWVPTVAHICKAHGLSHNEISMGVVGTYPTCLVDRAHVVKLCGPWFGGERNAPAEVAAMGLVAKLEGLASPRLLAYGPLVGSAPAGWSYQVSTYCPGKPLAELSDTLGADSLCQIARELGGMLCRIHQLEVPEATFSGERADWSGWMAGQYDGLAARLRKRASIPEQWVEQAEAYVTRLGGWPDPCAQCLIHADITADHVLVEQLGENRLAWSLIDWGDARQGDPYYELPALFLDALGGSKKALAAFLGGYGWRRDAAAQHRAMTMTLLHEFDVLGPYVAARTELLDIKDLSDLAEAIWAL